MNISLYKESKIAATETQVLCEEYIKRSNRYTQLSSFTNNKLTEKKTGTFIVVLDERGDMLDSQKWAAMLQEKIDDPAVKNLAFVVGGAHGLSDIQKKADRSLSISPMVLAGDVAWLVLHEQVYRALSILNGSKYHHA